MAIALPMLLLILLGTIDVARVFFDYIQMRNAVVEGATYGSRHPFDSAGIANAVTEHGLPGDASISSSPTGDCATPRGEGTIEVTADKTFTPIYVNVLESVAGTISWSFTVSATSSMRCLT
jgi:Flp pilus assembly protein TadG